MSKQSTNHIFMIEPSVFFANPETMETNVYQVEETNETNDQLLQKAIKEFRDYRSKLVQNGVHITTSLGHPNCPDMVFPNWMSMHRENDKPARLYLYPMLNKNRQAERTDDIINMFKKIYPDVQDWSHYEDQNIALESTASIVMDRVNKIGYSGLSARTDKSLVHKWCKDMDYKAILFETTSHLDMPVYHTDYLMFIGTKIAGICFECINEEYRNTVRENLSQTHEILELTMEQLQRSCGNALEVIGTDGKHMLTMSSGAYDALRSDQLSQLAKYYNTIITSPLPTLEKYGGGSARCMLMEMF